MNEKINATVIIWVLKTPRQNLLLKTMKPKMKVTLIAFVNSLIKYSANELTVCFFFNEHVDTIKLSYNILGA